MKYRKKYRNFLRPNEKHRRGDIKVVHDESSRLFPRQHLTFHPFLVPMRINQNPRASSSHLHWIHGINNSLHLSSFFFTSFPFSSFFFLFLFSSFFLSLHFLLLPFLLPFLLLSLLLPLPPSYYPLFILYPFFSSSSPSSFLLHFLPSLFTSLFHQSRHFAFFSPPVQKGAILGRNV